MPSYLPPKLTTDCQCRGNPMQATFCMTGHQLECHFPMDCQTAGCSHLSGYDFDTATVMALQERASAMLKSRANPECPDCQGGGMKTIKTTFSEMFDTRPWPDRMGVMEEIEVLSPCDCLEPFEEWKERMADEKGL